ncbi:MAG: hypothetical protein IT523_14560 [Burkholderiales bacterium]|nr:hypothetical protein [Burkholderiales bacterium]
MRRIFSLINTVLAVCALLAAAPASAAPGDLDTTFGSGFGMVRTAIGSADGRSYAIALQPDGKIIVAGYCSNGTNDDFCLVRYLADGALDLSFNSIGKVISPIGSTDDRGRTIALQPDGKIVVAGYCWNGSNYDFCLARYLADGALDTSFGSGGKIISPIGSGHDYARAIALQPDGKVVVAGHCGYLPTSYDFCLARYLANGTPDTSFGSNGTVISPIGSSEDSGKAIALQPDGKIVVAGTCVGDSNYDFCLARYQTDGTLDTSFNSTGKVISPIGSSIDDANAIALQPDGKIVVVGACVNGSTYDFCLARYQSNGALDAAFGSNGKVISPIGLSNDYGQALALQPDGKIVVAGYCDGVSNNDFCLARYQANGTLDTSFGSSGTVISPIGSSYDWAYAIALQPDGKIVVAGECWNGSNFDFCLARYQGGPFGYRNCTMDLDGDGAVLATTDALLLARTSLGMTGSAIINGISFASHATRTTWPAIREYLVTQCGMTLMP